MLGYATIGTNDLPRALAFYDALLAEVGAKRLMETPHGFTMYGVTLRRPALAITRLTTASRRRPATATCWR
jgi:catechol 2,3-dioxygenase-like lactoylglutathione lyase family enzyme